MTAISHKLTCTTPGHPGQWFGILLLAVAGLGVPAESRAQTGSVEGDRAALVALYDATDGPNWTENTDWNSSVPIGQWYGVTTRSDLRGGPSTMTHLYLIGNNLTGLIPPELGDLADLQILNLRDNNLTGSIPPELGDLTNLRDLELAENNLTGPIPPELGDMTSLEGLSLWSNNLTGPIPPELGDLTYLSGVSLGDNNLTGSIPPELGDLTNLRGLGLAENNLTGSIPPELGDLTNLRRLSLYGNKLTAPLPLSMTNLRRLDKLYIDNNASLCAPADAAFQEWLATVDDFRGEICAHEVPTVPLLAQMLLALLLLCGGAYFRVRQVRHWAR